MISKTRQKAGKYNTRQILEKEIEENIERSKNENNQTQVIGSESNENAANKNSTDSIILTEPIQTENELQTLSQRVDDAIENELKKTLGVLENELANAINGIKDSVHSDLAESFRSNNMAKNGVEPCGSCAQENVEEISPILVSSIQILIIGQLSHGGFLKYFFGLHPREGRRQTPQYVYLAILNVNYIV